MNYLQRFLATGYDPRIFDVAPSSMPIMDQGEALTPEQVEQWKMENEGAPPIMDQQANRERYGGTGAMGVSSQGRPFSPDPNAASGDLWSDPNTPMPIMGQSSSAPGGGQGGGMMSGMMGGGNSMNSSGFDWGQILGMIMKAYGGGGA